MIYIQKMSRLWLVAIALSISLFSASAQETVIKVSEMSAEQIQQLSYNDLLQLSLEDLITAANHFGMSADEMLEYFLNKDIVAASKKAEK